MFRAIVFGTIFSLGIPSLWLLSGGIYLFTLYLAYLSNFPALLGTLVFPGLSQFIWIGVFWRITGTFFNFLTMLCIGWLVLAILVIFASTRAEA
jgi:hypothetical protein